ncbi:hypothetical protein BHE74_00037104 [Ensete ventricosum]|nr:hypothetical protein BHE74_00037104 [Ensete ventricosum]
MMCEGLRGLGGLHDCTEELLYLPSSKQLFSNPQHKRWVDLELDGSIRLLDLLGSLRDCMMTTIEQIRDLEIALRRQGEAAAQSKNKMHARIHSDKKLEKDIKKCFRLLKEMDDNYVLFCANNKDTDKWMMTRTMMAATEITASILQSFFNFLFMPRMKTKGRRWSLLLKALHKRRVACEGEHKDVGANGERVQKKRYQLRTLQNSIEDIEAELEYGGSRNGHRNAIFARPLFGSRRAGCIGRKHLRARLRPPDSVVYNRPDVAMADQETATAMLSLPAPIRKQKDSLHRAETSTCSCSSS